MEAMMFENRCMAYKRYEDNWFNQNKKSCKCYKELKYARVYSLVDNIYNIHIPCTHNMGDVWLHLIVGEKRALLIDTGFGIGDLKSLVKKLCGDKELIVVNTHCHGDHSLGNYQFDRVYIHKYDAPALMYQMTPEYFYKFNHVGEVGIENHYYNDNDIISFKNYEIIPCEDGKTFDLGNGHEIILIHMGGHCAGNSMLLDRRNKILFSGDAILPFLNGAKGAKPEYASDAYFYKACSVRTYYQGLMTLMRHIENINSIFPAHGVLGLSPSIIIELLKATQNVVLNIVPCFDEERIMFNRLCRVKYLSNTLLYYYPPAVII